jgi:hypothetical protein
LYASYRFVRPQARPARQQEPESSPLKPVEHTPQRLRIDGAADADTVIAGDINLDRLRDARRLHGDSILLRRHHHRDQSRSRRGGRSRQNIAIALPPVKYLVRFTSYCRATSETDAPGANDAATISRFSASGHERLRRRPVAVVPITDFVDTYRSHAAKHHIRLGEIRRFEKAASGGRKQFMETLHQGRIQAAHKTNVIREHGHMFLPG